MVVVEAQVQQLGEAAELGKNWPVQAVRREIQHAEVGEATELGRNRPAELILRENQAHDGGPCRP